MGIRLLDLDPQRFAKRLRAAGGRGYVRTDPDSGRLESSSRELCQIADALASGSLAYRQHEVLFLAVGPESGALFGIFLHQSRRGQPQGGVRYWPFPSVEAFLLDGLRLSLGMSRKSALAGLWWGGGKGLIARQPGEDWRDPGYRRALYGEFGRFVTSLRGCFVAGEDAGTTPLDLAEIHRQTRWATCVPPEVGGSGNPSDMTAAGVVCAMEAALDVREMESLAGKTIAMQGAGNVGTFMIGRLLDKGVAKILATEISQESRETLLDLYGDRALEVRKVEPGDDSILAEPCDILAPNALGGTLHPKSIASIRASVVCGAANNQLANDARDSRLLAERGITAVPDYVANRMGIVSCCNEQYGLLPGDPAVQRHLGRDWEESVYNVTLRVLERARARGTTPIVTANELADERAREAHPLWGHRTRQIIDSLVADHWERS